MKKYFLLSIIKVLEKKASFKKLAAVFAAGFFLVFILGVLTLWAGFSVINYGVSRVGSVISKPEINLQAVGLLNQFRNVALLSKDCRSAVQNTLSLSSLLEKTPSNNFHFLKSNCFESSAQKCEGLSCENEQIFKTHPNEIRI